VSDDDKDLNDAALHEGGQILAAYEKPGFPRLWIITEAERRTTTVCFPDEY